MVTVMHPHLLLRLKRRLNLPQHPSQRQNRRLPLPQLQHRLLCLLLLLR
jgi:hypothetical protein